MRTYTIALSIVVHVIAACAALIVPLLATDELPAPRTATEFIEVVPPPQPPPPPPARVSATRTVEQPRADAAPLTIPDGIEPEVIAPPSTDSAPVDGGIVSFGNCNCAVAETVPPPPPPPAPVLRVGGNIRPPQKVTEVGPVYPPIARMAHKEGVVILEAVIGEDGAVRDVRVLRSIPLLDDAAMEAVRQWRFTPTLLNGQPVPVVMTVTVAFKLR
jgi:periplasmic protein TonB